MPESPLSFQQNIPGQQAPRSARKQLAYHYLFLLQSSSMNCEKDTSTNVLDLKSSVLKYPPPFSGAFQVLVRLNLASPSDPCCATRKTLVLLFDTKAPETAYLALFFSLHCEFQHTVVGYLAKNILFCCVSFIARSPLRSLIERLRQPY